MSKPKKDKDIEVPDNILRQLLTPSEVRMLKNRWQILQYLEEGLTIRRIAEKVKVGTDTVVRVSRMKERSSFRNILQKNREEKREFKTQTPWIFGKK